MGAAESASRPLPLSFSAVPGARSRRHLCVARLLQGSGRTSTGWACVSTTPLAPRAAWTQDHRAFRARARAAVCDQDAEKLPTASSPRHGSRGEGNLRGGAGRSRPVAHQRWSSAPAASRRTFWRVIASKQPWFRRGVARRLWSWDVLVLGGIDGLRLGSARGTSSRNGTFLIVISGSARCSMLSTPSAATNRRFLTSRAVPGRSRRGYSSGEGQPVRSRSTSILCCWASRRPPLTATIASAL